MSGPRQIYRYKDPSGDPRIPDLAVYFESESIINKVWTLKEGIQTYDSVLMAYVAPVGQPKSEAACEIERTLPDGTVKVHKFHSAKYAEQIKHYRAGTEAEALGTPLMHLPNMTPGMMQNLKVRGLHTIEMLAGVGDGNTSGIMGLHDWREKAKAFVAAREKDAPFVKMAADLEERDAKIATLERQMADLVSSINEKRGPGRPRKEQQEAA